MTRPILTITLNPTVDLATRADTVTPGPKLRCNVPLIQAGGGGVNVARTIVSLGGRCAVFMAVGGPTGDHLHALMRRIEGLVLHCFEIEQGETRQSMAVTDCASGAQYRFVMPGPRWLPEEAARAIERLRQLAPARGLVVLSGSQPPGLDAGFAGQLAGALPTTCQLVVDTSGAPLAHLVADPGPGIALLRMDHLEAEDLAGRPLPGPAESADFAASLVARGVARMVVLAHGKEGSVLVSAYSQLFCAAPPVPVVSKIGAGDSFVGAMVHAMARGAPPEACLRAGTAAACATVMSGPSDLCQRSDVDSLTGQCEVQTL